MLSGVTTSDVLSILISLINKDGWFVMHFPKVIYWNLSAFGLDELTVNDINTFFKSNWRLVKILLNNLLQGCIVLSSALLEISHFKTKKNKSLMKILNKSGPRIDPWGIPQIIFHHSLNTEPISVLCFLKDSRMQILYLLFNKFYFWFDIIWFWKCYWVFTSGSVWLYKRFHKMQLEQCLKELTLCIRGCSYEASWPG